VSATPPVNLLQLIEVLQARGDSEALKWVEPLRKLRLQETVRNHERCNLVSYVCGRGPKKDEAWISRDKPHAKYSGSARLEAVEVHLKGVKDLVETVYHKDMWK
jgi:hypothetical protein